MSVIKCLIDDRNTKEARLSIAKAKGIVKCDLADKQSLDEIQKQIQLLEASLFDQNQEYKQIVKLEHSYAIINAKMEAINEKAANKREKNSATSSKKRQKKSHERSKGIEEDDSSLTATLNQNSDSVLTEMMEKNQNIYDEISRMQSCYKSLEARLDQYIEPDEANTEEISLFSSVSTNMAMRQYSKERLSSMSYCGNTVSRSNRSLKTPFGNVNYNETLEIYDIFLADRIEFKKILFGFSSIVLNLDDLLCFKMIVISEDKAKDKVTLMLTEQSSPIKHKIDISSRSYTDAYCEYLNNRRLQQIDNLKSLIVEVEGMVLTKLIILLMMHNIFSFPRL